MSTTIKQDDIFATSIIQYRLNICIAYSSFAYSKFHLAHTHTFKHFPMMNNCALRCSAVELLLFSLGICPSRCLAAGYSGRTAFTQFIVSWPAVGRDGILPVLRLAHNSFAESRHFFAIAKQEATSNRMLAFFFSFFNIMLTC